jgi:hypothetical protein
MTDPRPDRDAARSLAWGAGAALVVMLVPFTRFVASYLAILVHELGHAVAGWVFGYPAIPAFDFLFGGGITFHTGRSGAMLFCVYALFATAAWWARRRPTLLLLIGIGAVIHVILGFTRAHEAIQIAAGHLSELVFAGLFLWRALDGSALRTRAERPAYAFAGSFLVLNAIAFAWRLATSDAARVEYGAAKGGGHWMDFSRLAHEFLGWELDAVARLYLVAAVVTPGVVALAWNARAARAALPPAELA